jgi:hypothetical protein
MIAKTLVSKIKSGNEQIQQFLNQACNARICSTALFQYLRSNKYGLLPLRVQNLIKSHNCEIPFQVIALDALGLLCEESRNNTKNFVILTELLQLMRLLATEGNLAPTEQFSSHAPYFIVPILFDKNPGVNYDIYL